jgi:hypothetical protein
LNSLRVYVEWPGFRNGPLPDVGRVSVPADDLAVTLDEYEVAPTVEMFANRPSGANPVESGARLEFKTCRILRKHSARRAVHDRLDGGTGIRRTPQSGRLILRRESGWDPLANRIRLPVSSGSRMHRRRGCCQSGVSQRGPSRSRRRFELPGRVSCRKSLQHSGWPF